MNGGFSACNLECLCSHFYGKGPWNLNLSGAELIYETDQAPALNLDFFQIAMQLQSNKSPCI